MVFIDDSVSDDTGLENIPERKKRKLIGVIKTKKKKSKETVSSLFLADLLNSADKDNICVCTAEVAPECIKKTLKYDETNVLQINIRYPNLKLKSQKNHEAVVGLKKQKNPKTIENSENIKNIEKAEKKINRFYNGIVSNFIKFSEGILFKSAANEYIIKTTKYTSKSKLESEDDTEYEYVKPFRAFGAVINYEVTYNSGNFLCIYLDVNIYTGRGRGRIIRKSHIWEMPEGILVQPKRFVDLNTENKKKICSRIYAAIQSQSERGEEYYINTDFKSVYRHFKAENMFITERGLNFFFPQNSLSPPECGIVSFIYS